MKTLPSLLAAAVVSTAASPVLAVGSADAAKTLFDRGLQRLEEGRFNKACPPLEESYRLDPRPGTLFTLAECEAKRGRLARAVQRYEEYLTLYATLTPDKKQRQGDREKVSRETLAALLPQVPEVTITLPPAAPPATRVTCDDAPVAEAALGAPMRVDPGDHVFTMQAPNGLESETHVTIQKGEKRAVLLQMSDAAASTAEAGAWPEGTKRVVAFTVGGLGAAGLGVGTVTGILSLVKHAAAQSACPTHNGCSQSVIDTASTGKALSTASTVAFAVGVAGLGIGTYLVLTSHAEKKATSVGLTVLPGGGGLTVRAAF